MQLHDNSKKILINAHTLFQQMHESNIVILYTEMKHPVAGVDTANDLGVIPGARYFDFDDVFTHKSATLSHTFPDVADFASCLAELGVKNDTQIVVYDAQGMFSAPRVWWMLTVLGHKRVKILDGGIQAWIDAKLPTVQALSGNSRNTQNHYRANFQSRYIMAKSDMLKAYDDQHICVIDARGAPRFSGKQPDPRVGVRSGHIPFSNNIPYTSVLDNGRFTSIHSLQLAFKHVIKPPHQRLVFTCGSGVTACVLAAAATVVGIDQWSVYDGSWVEWGSDPDCPIATGDDSN